MAKALTAKTLENMKPTGNRREIPDGGLPGLYFVVQPSGAMSWAVRYRAEGKPKKFTIGAYPAFELAEARQAASKALRLISEGGDPAADKALRKKAKDDGSSLTENVLDDFARRHIDKKCRPNTAKEYKRQIETEIKPKWKGRDIRSITRRNVSSLIDAIADRAPTLANRVLALLRKFFAWCEERDIVDLSPLTKRITPPRRRRAGNESCPTMKSGCSGKPATRSAGPLAR